MNDISNRVALSHAANRIQSAAFTAPFNLGSVKLNARKNMRMQMLKHQRPRAEELA